MLLHIYSRLYLKVDYGGLQIRQTFCEFVYKASVLVFGGCGPYINSHLHTGGRQRLQGSETSTTFQSNTRFQNFQTFQILTKCRDNSKCFQKTEKYFSICNGSCILVHNYIGIRGFQCRAGDFQYIFRCVVLGNGFAHYGRVWRHLPGYDYRQSCNDDFVAFRCSDYSASCQCHNRCVYRRNTRKVTQVYNKTVCEYQQTVLTIFTNT